MILWGYRLYKEPSGRLRFDQIVNGAVFALKPTEADADRPLGYYDYKMNPVSDGASDPDQGPDKTDPNAGPQTGPGQAGRTSPGRVGAAATNTPPAGKKPR